MNLFMSTGVSAAMSGMVQTPLPAGVSVSETIGEPLVPASPPLIWTAVAVILERTTVPVSLPVAVSRVTDAVPVAAELTDGVVTTCLSLRNVLREYCRGGTGWGDLTAP